MKDCFSIQRRVAWVWNEKQKGRRVVEGGEGRLARISVYRWSR